MCSVAINTLFMFQHSLSLKYILPSNITMGFTRSPEAKKRKAPANKAEGTNGPSAKKAKTNTESSEESSSEDEKTTKAATAGRVAL